jgi:hypothetical protein
MTLAPSLTDTLLFAGIPTVTEADDLASNPQRGTAREPL